MLSTNIIPRIYLRNEKRKETCYCLSVGRWGGEMKVGRSVRHHNFWKENHRTGHLCGFLTGPESHDLDTESDPLRDGVGERLRAVKTNLGLQGFSSSLEECP